MDSQDQHQSHLQNEKVEFVAQQLYKAFNSESQSDSNLIIFLSKLYKNNSPLKTKKMKSIRLNQFINFLQYVISRFPTTKQDTEVVYCSIVATLTNDKNFTDDQDYELIESVGFQIAKVIEKLAQSQFCSFAHKLLSYLVLSESLSSSLMDMSVFETTLKNSQYFQSINLDQSQNAYDHLSYNENKWHILEQPEISTIILDSIFPQKVYAPLFRLVEKKLAVVNLFYEHITKSSRSITKSKKELFVECFVVRQQKLTVTQVESILRILQKPIFDRDAINEIINKICQQKLTLGELIEIDFRKIKGVEEVFVQSLLQQSSKYKIKQVIELFLNMKNQENYFPLYLILKLNQKVPIEYINLFFQEGHTFTVRRGIIFVLAIADNQFSSFDYLMKSFLKWNATEKVRTKNDYNLILKAVHFSLQNISKANVVSHILRHIYKKNLNNESKLGFIGYNGLKVSSKQQMKELLTQQTRDGLCILFRVLSEFEGMTKVASQSQLSIEQSKIQQQEHKYRMDLQFMLNSNPYLEQQISSSIKQLNKLFEGNVNLEQLLRQLPTMKQNLLEVTLMYINNKYETFYQQQTNQQIVDWALKMYKKLTNDLSGQLKILLEKEKLESYSKLIRTLIDFNIERQQPLKFNPSQSNKIIHKQIIEIINSSLQKNQRMNSNNFNDYFLTQSKYKNHLTANNQQKNYTKIIWIKTLLIEVKSLIKNIVKAQKVGNRKEIKNIVAQNAADVLAFKIIHQYFDSELKEAPEMLIQVFRTVQPDIEFFQKTQALASSLNVEYYSIFQQMPHLLENFNSDTLIFLSKLIHNPKTGEQKKKTQKKKKEKQNQPEDSVCLNLIVKNFELLFGDPNQMDSFKSLFVILKKLVDSQKIQGNQLSKYLNEWLLKINFITCSNFDSWKNKVLSLSKMWKNASDLLSDKKIEKNFELNVLQKHFNLFTDLLNKLYENFRQEPEYLQIEQRILLSLCLIYKNQDFSESIEEQNSMTEFLIKNFQQRNMSRIVLDNRFYFCLQCKKNTCYACSSFLHRNHDKNYVGKTGICEHQTNGAHKNKKQVIGKSQLTSSLLGGVSALLKKNQDLPEQILQRIEQKLLIQQHLKASQQRQFGGRLRDSQLIRELLEGRISKTKSQRTQDIKKKIRQQERLLKGQSIANQDEKPQEDENTMTPQAQPFFQYKEPFCKQFKKIHSQFKYKSPKLRKNIPKINTSPLARVFLRQLQQNHFYNEEKIDKQTSNIFNEAVKVEEIKEKYAFFKNNNFKSDIARQSAFGRGRGGNVGGFNYGQNPRDSMPASLRRNIVASNKKYLLIPSNMSLMNFSMTKLKQKLDKRIQNKEFSQLDQQKNFVCCPPANLPYEVLELSFSNSATNPCIAVVGYNQLCFYTINADGRYGRQMNPDFNRIQNIIKFNWINDKKNLFAVAYNNHIRIAGISSSNNTIRAFSKAQIGKTIRDFDGFMNSKTYMLFILDTEGKLYYIDVDFREGKSAAYSPQDRIISLKDEQGNVIRDQLYSVKNINCNRLLLSLTNGTIRIAETSRQSNSWSTKKFDLKKIMKSDSTIVLEAIKILKCDDQSVTFSAIARKLNAFENIKTKKCSGQLIIVNFNTENQNLSSVFYTREQNIESYDTTMMATGQLVVTILNDDGCFYMFKHTIQAQNKQIVEKINLPIDSYSIKAFCNKLINSDFFIKVEEGGMLKNLQFKQHKNINPVFSISNTKQLIKIKEYNPFYNFISGITFQVELPSSFTDYSADDTKKQQEWVVCLKVKVLESVYEFKCSSKLRDIQLGFNIKETLEMFCHENQLKISLQIQYNKEKVDISKLSSKELQEFVKVKNVQIYGQQAKELYNNNISNMESTGSNAYLSAFRELFTYWHIYQDYNKQSFEEYVLNPYRHDFYNIDVKKLYKLKFDNPQSVAFKVNQINLLLKLQLLSQTLSTDKHYTKEIVEEYIGAFKKQLLSKQFPRKSLQNSLYRLAYSLSDLYQNYTTLTPGHPYHAETLINLHSVITTYQKWQIKKNLNTFDQLCTVISNLIFTSAVEVHLILQSIPDLIIELSSYFKHLITENKRKQFSQDDGQVSVARTCSRFISILCEYYQVMKNKRTEKIEENILFLLEQVFGQWKSQMPKQLIMNPFLYLESLLTLNQHTEVESVIDLYGLNENLAEKLKSQSFYDIERIEKITKKQKKDQNDEIKQEEERLLQSNSRWEAIQEEKDMEEEENQMYMQIEEEFDEDEEMAEVDEVRQLDVESRKENSFKGQNSALEPELSSVILKDLEQTVTKTILSHQLPFPKKLIISHYDFPFQMAIAMFRKSSYLNEKNVYFYLGLLYNLLKIIENNLRIRQNKNKILEFIKIVDEKIICPQYSSLFIVLNFFICPKYKRTSQNGNHSQYTLSKPEGSLYENFVNYYKQKPQRFAELITQYTPKLCYPVTKLSQIIKFSKFYHQNQLYNLRFISNLYLTFRIMGYGFNSAQQNLKVKEELLFKLVKHKIPVLKNIMLYEKWEEQLDRAKVLVGFETILSEQNSTEQKEKGIQMLYECGSEKPEKFVEQLLKDERKVTFLEEYCFMNEGLEEKTHTKLLQLLEIYYNS